MREPVERRIPLSIFLALTLGGLTLLYSCGGHGSSRPPPSGWELGFSIGFSDFMVPVGTSPQDTETLRQSAEHWIHAPGWGFRWYWGFTNPGGDVSRGNPVEGQYFLSTAPDVSLVGQIDMTGSRPVVTLYQGDRLEIPALGHVLLHTEIDWRDGNPSPPLDREDWGHTSVEVGGLPIGWPIAWAWIQQAAP